MVANTNPQTWQEYKSGLVSADIFKRFRIKADNNAKAIFIDPTPTTTDCTYELVDGAQVQLGITYEYISDQYALSASNAGQNTFEADTDTFVLQDSLLEKAIKWRWLSRLSMDYAEEKQDYLQTLSINKAQDGGATSLRADGGNKFRYPNIPETGIGLS